MQLTGLEIVNFRGIARLRLQVEPDATVLFGENAWGKTSLVEALQSTLGDRPLAEADFHRLANDRTTIARRMGISLDFRGAPPAELEPAAWRDPAGEWRLVLQWSGRRLDRGRARFRPRFLDAQGRELLLPDGQAVLLAGRIRRDHPLFVFHELRLADGILAPALATSQALHEDPEKAVGRIFERLLAVPHQVHPSELARGLEALRRVAERRPELFQALQPAGAGSLRRAADIAEAPSGFQGGDALADLARHAGAGMRQVALLTLVGAWLQAEAGTVLDKGAQPILVLEDPETHLHPIQLATALNLVGQLSVQKLITSASGSLMAGFPLRALRRLVRRDNDTGVFPDPDQPALGPTEMRRVAFHVRTHNADSLFARVWLLVEGETEAWLLPELARVWGLNFPLEGDPLRALRPGGAGPPPGLRRPLRHSLAPHRRRRRGRPPLRGHHPQDPPAQAGGPAHHPPARPGPGAFPLAGRLRGPLPPDRGPGGAGGRRHRGDPPGPAGRFQARHGPGGGGGSRPARPRPGAGPPGAALRHPAGQGPAGGRRPRVGIAGPGCAGSQRRR